MIAKLSKMKSKNVAAEVMKHALKEYIEKDFFKNHIKQYHKHPIYFKDGRKIVYDVER